MDVLKEIIFLDKLLRDVRELDANVLETGEIGLDMELFMLKLEKRDPRQEMMLLAIILTVSREPILVPPLLG